MVLVKLFKQMHAFPTFQIQIESGYLLVEISSGVLNLQSHGKSETRVKWTCQEALFVEN